MCVHQGSFLHGKAVMLQAAHNGCPITLGDVLSRHGGMGWESQSSFAISVSLRSCNGESCFALVCQGKPLPGGSATLQCLEAQTDTGSPEQLLTAPKPPEIGNNQFQ